MGIRAGVASVRWASARDYTREWRFCPFQWAEGRQLDEEAQTRSATDNDLGTVTVIVSLVEAVQALLGRCDLIQGFEGGAEELNLLQVGYRM